MDALSWRSECEVGDVLRVRLDTDSGALTMTRTRPSSQGAAPPAPEVLLTHENVWGLWKEGEFDSGKHGFRVAVGGRGAGAYAIVDDGEQLDATEV